MGSDSRRAPEAWCSWTGTLQAQIPTQLLTLLSSEAGLGQVAIMVLPEEALFRYASWRRETR